MRLLRVCVLCATALLFATRPVAASPIQLTWTTTVSFADASFPATVGEVVTRTITVDNGGTSLLSQSWSETDFVSFKDHGATGWTIQSTVISFPSSSGAFTTDASGNVVLAGSWIGSGATTTSWAGVQNGIWWNNGANVTACATGCVSYNNIATNLDGRTWTASVAATAVPEPASLLLLGSGFVGLAAKVRRRKKQNQ